jgi:hypothetical protein
MRSVAAKRKNKNKKNGGGRSVRRWMGAAGLFVAIVAGVTLMTVRREGQVYHTEPPAEVEAGDRVLVEVLNGCGVRGIARTVADDLRMQGFDVVGIGNATDFCYPATVVIDRSGSPGKALRVANCLGCSRVIRQEASDAFLDVSVILGSDGVWRNHRPAAEDFYR